MFLGEERNQAKVAKVLYKNGIVRNQHTVRGCINILKTKEFLTEGKKMKYPGPQKSRTVKTLEPIFETVSFYRVWKMFPTDKRQLIDKEKNKMARLFKNIAPLLDYFPKYLSLASEILRRKIRKLAWAETLSVFYEFCLRIVEVSWSIRESNMDLKFLPSMLRRQKHRFADLAIEPYRYLYDALQKGKVTRKNISALASFSINGDKDIYRNTFLRELHLTRISLKNPLEAYAEYSRIEDTAPRRAILEKLEQELHRIQRDLQKTANHKVKDMNGTLEEIIKRVEFLRKYIKKVG